MSSSFLVGDLVGDRVGDLGGDLLYSRPLTA